MKNDMKYTFSSYCKYGFTLVLEDGTTIRNDGQNADDIYCLSIDSEGEAVEQENGTFLVDGHTFVR